MEDEETLIDAPTMLGWSDQILDQMYLSQLLNVFVHVEKGICSNCRMYLAREEEETLIDGPTMLGWSDQILNHFYWPLLNV